MRATALRSHTPIAFVRAILLAYARRGIDPAAALRHAGIPPEALRDPEGRIAIEPFEALSAYAMRELDDEALGWFSRRLPWGSYGMLLRASATAPTLDVALRRWCRHHGLLTGDVGIELAVEGDVCVARVNEHRDLGELREFCLVGLLRNLHGVACWLADSRIALTDARFPYAAPPHGAAYARMFGAFVTFDALRTELRFEAVYLRLPVVRGENAVRQILRRPIPLMSRRYRQDRLLSQRIARHILASGGHATDAEAIARHFNISLRTLQRHLRDEGTSVLGIVAEARRAQAEDLLRRGDLPLKRIAQIVGYGDESSFGRAFRHWTGQSPAGFRRNAAPPRKGPGGRARS